MIRATEWKTTTDKRNATKEFKMFRKTLQCSRPHILVTFLWALHFPSSLAKPKLPWLARLYIIVAVCSNILLTLSQKQSRKPKRKFNLRNHLHLNCSWYEMIIMNITKRFQILIRLSLGSHQPKMSPWNIYTKFWRTSNATLCSYGWASY